MHSGIKTPPESKPPLAWAKSIALIFAAVACFHLAYTPLQYPVFGLFILGYAVCLTQLTRQKTVRRAFYVGLVTGYLCVAPQLICFWEIFNAAAVVLWLILAFWIGLFTAIVCGCIRRWGQNRAMWLVPLIWTGLEYFRSELYYLKFSWLNVGYALSGFDIMRFHFWGMYGAGFLVFAVASGITFLRQIKSKIVFVLAIVALLVAVGRATSTVKCLSTLSVVGIQLEFPSEGVLPAVLNGALKKNPGAQVFVLSEYTLDGPVPKSLMDWCRQHSRFLVVGGKDTFGKGANDYYNTAFVIGTNGDIVFKQAKRVPIQFFQDGLPAKTQELWNSPWGKIGVCICYDLSYTRVTDKLVQQGAQLLIVPTMDVMEWGRHEHELHALVAPVRATEYGIPIFRLASSGISQAVDGEGTVIAKTSFPGSGEILSATLRLPASGSVPFDRHLAPFCVVVTALVLSLLLALFIRDKRLKKGEF